MKSPNNIGVLIAAGAVIFVSFSSGFYYSRFYSERLNSNTATEINIVGNEIKIDTVDLSPLWKTWQKIDELYVGDETPSSQERVWGAISGLVGSLEDPYSVFFPPKESESFASEIRGDFQGVGMEIEIIDQVLTVVAPLKGTPAEKAGIKAGDKIIKIDDVSTEDMSINEAVEHIRGKQGTVVVLSIIRKESLDPIEVSITRDVINIPTVEAKKVEDESGIFSIQLHNFSANSPDLFRKALRSFAQLSFDENYDKLILDLRNNPGGFLDAAVDMASWFLPAGKVVVKEDFGKRGEGTVYRSKGYNVFTEELKMVILINKGSASASEILAGSLSQHGVATLIGETTFGKGSVQQLVDITPDTSLKITVARWLLPNGDTISKTGIKPDIEVKLAQEDIDAGKDTQLDAAIEYLKKM